MADEFRAGETVVEQRLAGAASALDDRFAGVDVTPAVMARIAARPSARARRLRLVMAAAAVIAVAVAVTLLVPAARSAVARWLGFKAIEVRFEEFPVDLTVPRPTAPVPGSSAVSTPPLAADLFGTPVTAAQAEQRTGLDVPGVAALGEPDAIYVDTHAVGGGIIAVYAASADLPDGTVPGVGAIVEVVRGHIDGPMYSKFADLDTVVETAVDGIPALFVGGGPHEIVYVNAAGEPIFETARLAGPTLLWDRDDVTLRLESNLSLTDAVALAETVTDGTP